VTAPLAESVAEGFPVPACVFPFPPQAVAAVATSVTDKSLRNVMD
jgi:hypothetical protein